MGRYRYVPTTCPRCKVRKLRVSEVPGVEEGVVSLCDTPGCETWIDPFDTFVPKSRRGAVVRRRRRAPARR